MSVVHVGVRHHSPACARVVAAVIGREQPDFVLIEGPADFNARVDLFAYDHRPPLALFAYLKSPGDAESPIPPLASFYPLAEHSPEWVAIRAAHDLGATLRFIDLPSYVVRERSPFGDGPLPVSAGIVALARSLGFDDFDGLWDHLFEARTDVAATEIALGRFFDAFRADERTSPSDEAREAYMAACVVQAQRERPDAKIVVITGGFHTPVVRDTVAAVLAGRAQAGSAELPEPPPGALTGIDLVPYSFSRLDALRGYAAGMRGPSFYAGLWELGAAEGGQRALRDVVKALRAAKVALSPADAIALATTAEGLRRMRDNETLSRSDLLDAVRVALVKEDLAADDGSHPILAAVESLFCGGRRGRVDARVPRPPLLGAVDAELARLELALGGSPVDVPIDPRSPRDRDRAVLLHRLRLLAVPGIEWQRPRPRASGAARLERFRVVPSVDFEPALLEASAYGATPETAASALLELRAANYRTASPCALAVADAVRARLPLASDRLLARLSAALQHEGELGELGFALFALVDLTQLGLAETEPITPLLAAGFARGLWLLESSRLPPPLPGSAAPPAPPRVPRLDVQALGALREVYACLLESARAPIQPAALDELLERYVRDAGNIPAFRGAALGWLAERWPVDAGERLARELQPLLHPSVVGDVLLGLFVVGREALRRPGALVTLLDGLLAPLDDHGFLVVLPALRAAFGELPPRDRRRFAEVVAAANGLGHPGAVLGRVESEAALLAGVAQENEIFARARRYGLIAEGPS